MKRIAILLLPLCVGIVGCGGEEAAPGKTKGPAAAPAGPLPRRQNVIKPPAADQPADKAGDGAAPADGGGADGSAADGGGGAADGGGGAVDGQGANGGAADASASPEPVAANDQKVADENAKGAVQAPGGITIELATPQDIAASDPAKAGVGKQGRGYGGGIITEPIRQYFLGKQRIDLEIQIPNQMKTYKALNNDKYPADVQAYVREILEPLGVQLPELPVGEVYVYNPKNGELLVRKPNPNAPR